MKTFTTSGSTGKPKSFTLTDEELHKFSERRCVSKGPEFGALKSLYCDVPMSSLGGYAYQLWAAAHDVRLFLPPGGPIDGILAVWEREAIEGIVSNTEMLVRYAMANAGRPHRFCVVLASGMGTTAAQSREIRAGLGEFALYGYGCSEVGSIAIATAAEIEAQPGCAGRPCPGVQLEIVNDGEVRVKTGSMIRGYADPDLTAARFRDGWFYPGDRGRWTSDGLIVLEPRGVVKGRNSMPGWGARHDQKDGL